MQNNMLGQPIVIEEIDDRPKWRAVTVLGIGLVILAFITFIILTLVISLRLSERAELSIRESAAIADMVRDDKAAAWQFVFWSIAVTVAAVPVGAWGFVTIRIVGWILALPAPNWNKPAIRILPPEREMLPRQQARYQINEQRR